MQSILVWRSRAREYAFLACAAFLVSCSSGTSSSTPSLTEGVELPSELSAVSVRDDAGSEVRIGRARASASAALLNYRRAVLGAVEDLDPDSDYYTVQIRKFVDVKALDVFSIISTIFDAVRQTHYADEGNIDAGWYKCLVSFEESQGGGSNSTELQEWYVNSEFATIDGEAGQRITVKIIEKDSEFGESLVTVQVDATQAPTENEDGTLEDLGVWEIRATFHDMEDGEVVDEESTEYFHATAGISDDGTPVLTIADQFSEDGPDGEFEASTRAIIYRSLNEGYGAVEIPDWEACFGGPDGPSDPDACADGPPLRVVTFAYNEDYLTVQVEGDDARSFDRTDEHEIVHRYKIFTEDGSDAEKTTSFGFPVTYENDEGDRFFGWYGAWQDRHELWIGGDQAEDGATVVRQNFGDPEAEDETYTVRRFDGALMSIGLVTGSLGQLEGIPAEVFLFNVFRLIWDIDTETWNSCIGFDGFGGCNEVSDYTSKLASLARAGDGDQRWVWINACLPGDPPECFEFVYDSEAETPGFYVAEFNPETGQLESTGEILDTGALEDGFELWVGISGRTYIQYTGEFDGEVTSTGWVEKTLTDFDLSTWMPVFDDDADREFHFDLGREYFIHNRGTNLRVRRVDETGDEGDYVVYMEVQSVAKPSGNLDEVYPEGTILQEPWDPDNASKYELVTDPDDDNYLLLVYSEVGENDSNDGVVVGDVVTRDFWGLRIEGDDSAFEEQTFYNWEYQEDSDQWGSVSYLVDADTGDFVLVSDPIRFVPIALARTDDLVNDRPEEEWLSYSLAFDGFLHGLPDTSYELQKVNFEGDRIPSVLAKNVRIPDGTELTDANGDVFYTRAVDVGIFLGFVTEFPDGEEPDLSQADSIDLDSDLPEFVDPEIDTTIPEDAELLYVEGIPVD